MAVRLKRSIDANNSAFAEAPEPGWLRNPQQPGAIDVCVSMS
jgi:hypothetical protein